jgi:hypothetical protein
MERSSTRLEGFRQTDVDFVMFSDLAAREVILSGIEPVFPREIRSE